MLMTNKPWGVYNKYYANIHIIYIQNSISFEYILSLELQIQTQREINLNLDFSLDDEPIEYRWEMVILYQIHTPT